MKGTQPCINMGLRIYLHLFTERRWRTMASRKSDLMCKQKSDSSVGTLESEWGSWICVPDFLTTSCCSMRRKGRLWWQLVTPRFLVDLLHKFLYLSVFCLFWGQSKNTDWMLNSLSALYLGIQNSFLPVCYSICCWNKGPKSWDLRKFFPEGKRLIKAMDHYYGGKEWLSPLWEMRRGP